MNVLAIGNDKKELKGGWFLENELTLAQGEMTREWNVLYLIRDAWTENQTMEVVDLIKPIMPTKVVLAKLIKEFENREQLFGRYAADEAGRITEQYYDGKSAAYCESALFIKRFIDEHYEELA